jgi:hypothetical protein
MGEPEDLIIDGAFIASRLARQARRRYSPPPAASVLPLADVRLELILNGLFEAPIAAAAAPPPASVSWLARSPDTPPIHQRTSRRGRTAFVFSSPRTLDASAGLECACRGYLLLAVAQTARVDRRSTAIALAISDAEVRDRFLIADAHGVFEWIVREARAHSGAAYRSTRRARTPPSHHARAVRELSITAGRARGSRAGCARILRHFARSGSATSLNK